MADIKMINNYNIKDETARNEIEALRAQIPTDVAVATEGFVEQYVYSNMPSIPTEVSELNNDAGYVTEQYVNDAINNIEIPQVDTSNLATKEELNNALGYIESLLGNI